MNMQSGCYIILNKTRSTDKLLNVKIGCSKDCIKRFSQIQSSYRFNGSNDELQLMQIIPCVKYKKLEKILHTILSFARDKYGEWFTISEEKLNSRLMLISLSDYK
jgi:hypothetical protein